MAIEPAPPRSGGAGPGRSAGQPRDCRSAFSATRRGGGGGGGGGPPPPPPRHFYKTQPPPPPTNKGFPAA
ncbi:hypothetical protein WAF95_22180, partial [Xanthomonas perforans]